MTLTMHNPKAKSNLKAFTLVELSIVLVILGLLVGGVLTGQSLIRAAELRSVGVDYNKYVTAANAFRDKYFALPGDLTNATSFWGSAGGNGGNSACSFATHVGTATCNGDGNGQVQISNSNMGFEASNFWQHLSNAGLIEGNFNGSTTLTPGVSVPASKIAPNYFYTVYYAAFAGDGTSFAFDSGNSLVYSNNIYAYGTANSAPLRPEDAWNIDTKMDDGKPGTGRIIVAKGNGSTSFCTTADNVSPPGDANAAYALNKTNKDCVPTFMKPF